MSRVLHRDGFTYHSDIQQTKLRARRSPMAYHCFLLRPACYGDGGGGGCCSKGVADLIGASPQVLCPFGHHHAVGDNGLP